MKKVLDERCLYVFLLDCSSVRVGEVCACDCVCLYVREWCV